MSLCSLSTLFQLTQVLPRAWWEQGGQGGLGKMRTGRERERELWSLGALEGPLLWARVWGLSQPNEGISAGVRCMVRWTGTGCDGKAPRAVQRHFDL